MELAQIALGSQCEVKWMDLVSFRLRFYIFEIRKKKTNIVSKYGLIRFHWIKPFTHSFNKLSAFRTICWCWFRTCFCHNFDKIADITIGLMSGNFSITSCSRCIPKPWKCIKHFRIFIYVSVLTTTISSMSFAMVLMGWICLQIVFEPKAYKHN